MNAVMQLLQSHRSIRKFTDKPVDDGVIHEILRCGQAAATSSNIQATTVIRVRKVETRNEIARVAEDQGYVATAGAFLVFCADLNQSRQACEMQGGGFVTGMTEHFIIATVDVALAYDEQLRNYYKTRTGGTKDSCWTREVKALVGKEARPHMRGF